MQLADIIALGILLLAVWGWWATFQRYWWWKRLRPSPLMASLLGDSIAIDLGVLPLVFLAARRLLFPEAASLGTLGILLLGLSLMILLASKLALNYRLRSLDKKPNESIRSNFLRKVRAYWADRKNRRTS
jgi:hypothetical protein